VILIPARKIVQTAMLLAVAAATTFAAEASETVIPHRAWWPDAINSPAEFDRASRAEILVFAHELAESDALNANALRDRLGTDTLDMPSVERLRRRLWNILAENYVIASSGCAAAEAFCPADNNPNNLRHDAEAFSGARIQPRYGRWFDDAVRFQRSYLDELLLLAAVFPHHNSEVETFNDNELTGWDLHDRQFLLSFDDGPTRGPRHEEANAEITDRTLAALRNSQINAIFFVVGKTFQARVRDTSIEAMKTLYADMCVGSHGWAHESHAAWPQWQESVASSTKLLHDTLPEAYVPAFRPPYGQRPPDSGPHLRERGVTLVLWNIDAHDWDNGLKADDVEQRVMSLMLLWRRGFIVFHDVFPRAEIIVPHLVSWLAHDDVKWADCHAINWSRRHL
jgi:peptidoglycan/xylan/chitin deacetylase (PgdA/CDA1 family)